MHIHILNVFTAFVLLQTRGVVKHSNRGHQMMLHQYTEQCHRLSSIESQLGQEWQFVDDFASKAEFGVMLHLHKFPVPYEADGQSGS